jgi:hypothetical protein
LLAPDLFCPGIRNIGGFTGAALLAAPHPLLVHNVSPGFPVETLKSVYGTPKEPSRFQVEQRPFDEGELVQWISRIQ